MSHDCKVCECVFPITSASSAEDILRHHRRHYRIAILSLAESGITPDNGFAYGDLDSAYWALVEEEDARLEQEAADEEAEAHYAQAEAAFATCTCGNEVLAGDWCPCEVFDGAEWRQCECGYVVRCGEPCPHCGKEDEDQGTVVH